MHALKFRSNALVAIGLYLCIRIDKIKGMYSNLILLWFCGCVSDSTLARACFLSQLNLQSSLLFYKYRNLI